MQHFFFSDECKLCPQKSGSQYIRRRYGEVIQSTISLQKAQFHGRLKIIVWGSIAYSSTRLVRIEENLNTLDIAIS